ncbi:YbaN family protein [Laribacter hongkongensis]|uniref:YbaN family protein n=1 Tax=Laribacter hongkongensis TaxID=168471 RepID=UPI001EFEEE3C|nr:YbaN family protein [Laribacter hongkongensis]MCG9076850.1 YbaN family protein [Laribacter hongkongensis]
MKYLLWLAGCLSFALGVVGLVVPLLPTTPFVLLAAACWARVSPRFHRWLARHRLFGPMVTSWERERAVPRRAKYWAIAMMAVSWLLSVGVLASRWQAGIALLVTLVLTGMAVWLWRRPEPRSVPSHPPAGTAG